MTALSTEKIPSRSDLKTYSRQARLVYEKLKQKLEQEHWGEYVVINPTNGDYFVGVDRSEVLAKAKIKYPNVLMFSHRIGYRASLHFGRRGISDRSTEISFFAGQFIHE
jgi:hypothetical protein